MATMLNVYDRTTLKKTAVLQNAYNIDEVKQINQIYTLSFTMPSKDEKNKYCLPRHFVRFGDDGELYRIKSPRVSDSSVGTITYDCEHVITTLCDDVMFGSYTYGGRGVYTTNTITWLLSRQKVNDNFKTRNWKLKECDFSRQFEYNWEQENLLNALYSIPKEFTSDYMWVFDTTNYPWKISLKQLKKNIKPEYYLQAKSNILSSGTTADYSNICTRLYALGYGEGVNQLTIRNATVNSRGEVDEENGEKYGKTYIESPQSYIDKYGIVEKVLVDRRFEHANSLYSYAKATLEAYQEPTMSRTFNVTDLYQLTNDTFDDAEVGKLCKMTEDNTVAIITKTQRSLDVAGDLKIDLSTRATDVASSVADLADRIRIESVYAQGATQIYQHSKDANATPAKGMILSLYFPAEMKQINKVLLHLRLGSFRAYSNVTSTVDTQETTTETTDTELETTQSNTWQTTTSGWGGKTLATTLDGGGSGTTGASVASASITGAISTAPAWTNSKALTWTGGVTVKVAASVGGVQNITNSFGNTGFEIYEGDKGHYHNFSVYFGHDHSISASGGLHEHPIELWKFDHNHQLNIPEDAHFGSHSHTISFKAHSHQINLPNHTHEIKIEPHSHKFEIPGHYHEFTIPGHNHTIVPGIFEHGNPSYFSIYLGGKFQATIRDTSYDGDITQWLLNSDNQVPRDQWIDVEIRPNDLAYVQASVFVQGFVQSRGGGNY